MSMVHTIPRARFSRRLLSWMTALLPRRRRRRLDPRMLSDHLKRDVGFLDGRRGTVEARPCWEGDFPGQGRYEG
ncbi:hypothetical protein [Chelativorans sp. AA-79]|uniref:hypothetical protein n=1 Tax=Chelativorans sp. AA-79 TaxID=3028735 RepID=UPI0023F9F5F2|nr:hypothetical protein [Chelativorans sp. AA-79]WEX08291.1 hypothetical protein PVE73_19750 [Chelativorans sp. AA-79]